LEKRLDFFMVFSLLFLQKEEFLRKRNYLPEKPKTKNDKPVK